MSNKTHNAADVGQFTSAPWEAFDSEHGADVAKRAANGSLDLLADLCYSVPQGEERKANARLMAAAPDLLDALDWLARCAAGALEPRDPEAIDDYHYLKDIEHALGRAHEAIARAKGVA